MSAVPASPIRRLALTGSSGYLGSRFIEHVRGKLKDVEILGLDLREPAADSAAPDRFVAADILSEQFAATLRSFEPDTVVHAACVVTPMRDEQEMRRINVEGAANVLQAAVAAGAERLMVVSSATAYGAWPDNPLPIEESWPLRAADYRYAADKVEIEALAEQLADEHPEIAVSRVRPAMIGGPGMDNYLYRFIFGMPILIRIGSYDTPVQFVHEQDVAAAMYEILAAGGRGAYNIGPPDWITISDIASETRRWVVPMPFWLATFLHWLAWTTRFPLHESPAGFLTFVRYRWVVAPTRLERELGYRFRYSSHDTLLEIVKKREGQRVGLEAEANRGDAVSAGEPMPAEQEESPDASSSVRS